MHPAAALEAQLYAAYQAKMDHEAAAAAYRVFLENQAKPEQPAHFASANEFFANQAEKQAYEAKRRSLRESIDKPTNRYNRATQEIIHAMGYHDRRYAIDDTVPTIAFTHNDEVIHARPQRTYVGGRTYTEYIEFYDDEGGLIADELEPTPYS